jgi:hypothetical protein
MKLKDPMSEKLELKFYLKLGGLIDVEDRDSRLRLKCSFSRNPYPDHD